MTRRTLALLLLAVFLLLSACGAQEPPIVKTPDYAFEIHFLDVGQGDAVLLLSDGRTALVDAGLQESGDKLVRYLTDYGIERIDLLVLSHPHADHMGSMAQVLDTFAVTTFVMPDVVHTTAGFEAMLDAIARNGCDAQYGLRGDEYLVGQILLTVLSPGEEVNALDLNNASLVLMAEADGARILLTGDAEQQAEQFLLENRLRPADILKVGHHGSVTSSGEDFLDRVDADIAIISCGAGNAYGHPHKEILKRLEARGAEIYRTDENGTIIIGVEKGEIYVTPERIPTEEPVGSGSD